MEKCKVCRGSPVVRLVPEYRADLLGAPFDVILFGAVKEEICSECSKVLKTTIPDLEGLLHRVAATRALSPRKLNGAEIRFLRHAMGWKAKDVADKLDMTPENLSRVEHDAKPLGSQSEKLFRIYVIAKKIEKDELESAIATKLAELIDLKIEPFWDADDKLEFAFERVCKESTDCGNSENGKWDRKGQKAA